MKPMLACSTIPNLDEIKYPTYISPKLDGIRCLTTHDGAVSRNLKAIPNHHVREVLSKVPQCLDGELVLMDPTKDFNDCQSAFMSQAGSPMFEYHVFDLARQSWNFEGRLSRLQTLIDEHNEVIKIVPQYLVYNADQARHYWDLFVEQGYEGAILKAPDGPYKYGRSTLKQEWMLKLKTFDDAEGYINGFEELMHNENSAEVGELGQTKRSHELGGMVPGNTLGALHVQFGTVEFKIGTGFDEAMRKHIWNHRQAYMGELITFKYQELSKYGIPRFPVFKGFRAKADIGFDADE